MNRAFLIRPIRPGDDAAVAATIRAVMTELGCAGPGFAIHDQEVDRMSASYASREARYYVLVAPDGELLGGAGFARLAGSDPAAATCELRKMYFRPAARGQGLGAQLLDLLLDEMRAAGFARCYLETTSWMHTAQALYRSRGFVAQSCGEGATGHHGCDVFYARAL
jgi:putative acetyltransferase